MNLRMKKSDAQIVQDLSAHFSAAIPCDIRERESIAKFLEIVPTLSSPFDEHADPTHITGSAIVIGKRGPKNRYSAVKNLAQAGIYRICAAHLEEVLKGRL